MNRVLLVTAIICQFAVVSHAEQNVVLDQHSIHIADGGMAFSYHTIDNQGVRLGQTSIADMDNDGDLDWITGQAFHAGSKIWWWEYQSPDHWVKHDVGQGNTDVGGSVHDLDGDGWLDLFSGSKILMNTGNPKSEPFEVFEIGATVSHDSSSAGASPSQLRGSKYGLESQWSGRCQDTYVGWRFRYRFWS